MSRQGPMAQTRPLDSMSAYSIESNELNWSTESLGSNEF